MGRGGSWNFDAEFKFVKIQNSHVGGGGRLWKFDAELKFAKIQNSHLWWGGGGKGGGCWNQLSTFDAESKFAKNKPNFFAKNFLSFQAKSITVLFWTLSIKWFPYTKYRRTTIISSTEETKFFTFKNIHKKCPWNVSATYTK